MQDRDDGSSVAGMTLPMMTLAATLAAMTPDKRKEAEFTIFVNAVGAVESNLTYSAVGDGNLARGAYQMHVKAWADANAWRKRHGMPAHRWSAWKDKGVQQQMATAYLHVCKERLEKAGVEPSWANVYMTYTWGFTSFKNAGFDRTKAPPHKQKATDRVVEIVEQLIK